MDNQDHERAEATLQDEDEYCTVCHTVYAAEEGCWCVGPNVGRARRLRRAGS